MGTRLLVGWFRLWTLKCVCVCVCFFLLLRLKGHIHLMIWVHTCYIRSKREDQGVEFDLEFMTKEAGDEDYYNVGIVGVRRDHTHHSEELEAELRGCQRWINWRAEQKGIWVWRERDGWYLMRVEEFGKFWFWESERNKERDSSLWWGTLMGYIGSLGLVVRLGKAWTKVFQLLYCPFPISNTFLSFFLFILFNFFNLIFWIFSKHQFNTWKD